MLGAHKINMQKNIFPTKGIRIKWFGMEVTLDKSLNNVLELTTHIYCWLSKIFWVY